MMDSLAVASNEDTDALVSDEVFNQTTSTLPSPPISLSAANGPTDFGDTSEDSDSKLDLL